MVATVVSTIVTSPMAIGATIAGCLILAVMMLLSDDNSRPRIALFSRHIAVFLIPLLVVFGFLAIIWAAGILTA